MVAFSESTFFSLVLSRSFHIQVLFHVVCFFVLAGSTQASPNDIVLEAERFDGKGLDGLKDHFREYRVYKVDLQRFHKGMSRKGEGVDLAFHWGDDHRWETHLKRYDLRSSGYVLRTSNGEVPGRRSEPPFTYKGYFTKGEGAGSSVIRLSIRSDHLSGLFMRDGEVHVVEPVHRFVPDAPRDLVVLYTIDDLIEKEKVSCGVETRQEKGSLLHKRPEAKQRGEGDETFCSVVEIALAADKTMVDEFGSVPAVETEMIDMMNLVNGLYQPGPLRISYVLTETYVSTDPTEISPVGETAALNVLRDFQAWGNGGGFTNPYDVASFWTDRDFNGTTIGKANDGAICNTIKYNVLQHYYNDQLRDMVTQAHELGHNWTAGHVPQTNIHVMAPQNMGPNDQWHQNTITSILNYKKTRVCLDNCDCYDSGPASELTFSVDTTWTSAFGECDGEATVTSSGGVSPYTVQWPSNAGSQTGNTATGLCAERYRVIIEDDDGCKKFVWVQIDEPDPEPVGCQPCLKNPSFEDGAYCDPNNITSNYWDQCSQGTSDTQPTDCQLSWPSSYPASDGNWYVGFGGGWSPTWDPAWGWMSEAATQTMCSSFIPGQEYTISVDATVSSQATGANPDNDDGKLQVWCGNGPCDKGKLLLTTGWISTRDQWQTFTATFTPQSACNSITLIPKAYTPDSTEYTNTYMLVDNIRITTDSCVSPPRVEADLFPKRICEGSCTELEAEAFHGNPPYAFTWGHDSVPDGPGPHVVCPDQTTDYIVTVTDSSGETDKDTVTVVVDPLPDVVAGGDTTVCQGECVGLSVSGGNGYEWSPDSTLDDPTLEDPLACPDVSTIYSVVGTDTNGCKASDNITVNIEICIEVALSGDTVCEGGSGQLEAVASGNNPPFTYDWSGGGLGSASGPGPHADAPDSTTSYQVIVTDAEGNMDTATSRIVVNPLPDVDVDGEDTICAGASGILTASGADTYSWNPGGQSSASITVSPISDTWYFVTGTDTNGCSSTDSMLVSVGDATASFAQPDTVSCENTRVTLDASSSTTSPGNPVFAWSTLNGNIVSGSNTTTPEVNRGGDYQLIVSDDVTGCSDTVMVTVVQTSIPPLAVIDGIDTLDCEVTSMTLDGSGSFSGSGTHTYQWSTPNGNITTGATGPTIGIDAPGDYELLVHDPSNDCRDSTTVYIPRDTVTPDAEVSPAAPPALTCYQPTQVLDVSGSSTNSGGIGYEWFHNGSIQNAAGDSSTVTIDAGGTYTVIVSDPVNKCVDTASVMVPVDTAHPAIDIAPFQTITCNTPVDTVDASGTTGNDLSFSWSTSDGNIMDAAGDSSWVVIDSGGGYALRVTDTVNGCIDTTVVDVSENTAPPVVSTSPDTLLCPGEVVTISASGGVNYSWSPATGLSDSNIAGPLVTLSNGAVVDYTVTVTAANGCTDSGHVRVEVGTPIDLTPSSVDATCYGVCDGELYVDVSGGIGDLSQWSFSWEDANGNVVGSDSTAQNVCAGAHSVVVTDLAGCSDTAFATVGEPPVFDIEGMGLKNETCYGDCSGRIAVDAPRATSYKLSWTNGEVSSTDSSFGELCGGTYVVTAIDPRGCTTEDTAEVISPPEVVAAFNYSPDDADIRDPEVLFANNSRGGDAYRWDLGDGDTSRTVSPYHVYSDSVGKTYRVCLRAWNDSNCVDSICKFVEIDDVFSVYVPNAFTPDGDNINEGFRPVVEGITGEAYHFRIWDRWGELIFESSTPGEAWNGEVKGVPEKATADVYVWKLRVRSEATREYHDFTGHVTLLD